MPEQLHRTLFSVEPAGEPVEHIGCAAQHGPVAEDGLRIVLVVLAVLGEQRPAQVVGAG